MSDILGSASAQLIAAIGTFIATSGFTLAFTTWYQTRQHDRALYGHPRAESDHGLVGRVSKNTEFRRHQQARADGGDVEESTPQLMTDGGRTSPPRSTSTSSLAGRLKQLLPVTLHESGWAYNGPFSTYKEAHAAILGSGAGYSADPALQAAVVAYATGRGAAKSQAAGERADAHWRQVAEEPAYAVGALAVGQAARRQGLTAVAMDVAGALL